MENTGMTNCSAYRSKPVQKRIASVDILKGFAMIMVILVHYNQSFRAANVPLFQFCQMGCQAFFVASGFGAALSFTKKLKQHTFKAATKEFYLSRLRAIGPSWWLMIAVVYLINTISLKITGHTLDFGENRSAVGIIFNALFLHGLNPVCNNNVMPGGWYIGTIMILYVLSPFIIALFQKLSPLKACVISSLSSLFSVVILTLIAYQIDPQLVSLAVGNNSFGYFSFLAQYPSFCLGILLYYNYSASATKRKYYIDLAVGSAILLCAIVLFFHPFFTLSYILCASLVGLSSYFILKSMIQLEENKTAHRGPIVKTMIALGKNSLYIYLVHAFFAFTFVSAAKKALSYIGLNGDSYFSFIILFPVVVFLSYFSGILLKKVTNIFISR